MADQPESPRSISMTAFLGRLFLGTAFTMLLLLFVSMFLTRPHALPRDMGLGLVAGAMPCVALLAFLSYGPCPVRPIPAAIAGAVLVLVRLIAFGEIGNADGRLFDAALALLATYMFGCAVAHALLDGRWALRGCLVAGAIQFIYFQMGFGPGAMSRLALAPAAPQQVYIVWKMTPLELMEYGTQAFDLIFLGLIVAMASDGKLRFGGSVAAVLTSAVVTTILTTATGKPVPSLLWLALLLLLYRPVDEDVMEPIVQRNEFEEYDEEAEALP